MEFGELPEEDIVNKTMRALSHNGMNVIRVSNRDEAKTKVIDLIPDEANVMNMTSVTLQQTGLENEIRESCRFNSVRKKTEDMDMVNQSREINRLRSAPDYALGSVHAITEDGMVYIASATGSQLPAYAYGAEKVIWVVGIQKIVTNSLEAMRRIYEHSLPLEDVRSMKEYGVNSAVNKILTINREAQADRITIVLVNEVLGY